jgi:hypothetical protein
MNTFISFLLLFLFLEASSQTKQIRPVQIMPVGVFHFAYPEMDAVKTAPEDRISVLDQPWQTQIIAIANALAEFKPTIIALEREPIFQSRTDSLYTSYLLGEHQLRAGEDEQLGFRIAAMLNLKKVYCIDDFGVHYPNILEIFEDVDRVARFTDFYLNDPLLGWPGKPDTRVKCIHETLMRKNDPELLKQRLGIYLLHPFKYEEEQGDFAGVDFESGRWFNRNLRIFRNIQRLPQTDQDRILLIIGSEHLNLLNLFFDISPEFELVSPLPYLRSAASE